MTVPALPGGSMITLSTDRLILRPWRPEDRPSFALMNADPQVMEHFPAPLTADESNAVADQTEAFMRDHGWGRWAVDVKNGASFIGFVGLQIPSYPLPFGPCVEVAWRLAQPYWGQGYASEAARAALTFGFTQIHLDEIVSFTAHSNRRSQAVMKRLGMTYTRDFLHPRLDPAHFLAPHVLYTLKNADWKT